MLASGEHIDGNKVERFGRKLESIYANPFEKRVKQPQTAAEIKEYILGKLEEFIHGSDDAGGEDRPG